MQAGNVTRVRTISTEHFTGAIVQNAAETEIINPGLLSNGRLGGAGWGLAAGGRCTCRLHELRILSVENLDWAFELYASSVFPESVGVTIDTLLFLGRWEFTAAMGAKDTADTWWKYWVPGLDLSIIDAEVTSRLYMRLVNKSAASKTAGAGGAVVVELGVEPTQGW